MLVRLKSVIARLLAMTIYYAATTTVRFAPGRLSRVALPTELNTRESKGKVTPERWEDQFEIRYVGL